MRLNIIKRIKKREKKVAEKPKVDTSTLLNIENIKKLLGNSDDVKCRNFLINNKSDMSVNLIYIDGLVNSSDVSDYVVKPIVQDNKIKNAQNLDEVIKLIQDGAIYFSSQTMSNDLQEVLDEIVSGSSVILFSDQNTAFIYDTKGFDKRAIAEPTVELVSKGPKDAFVESFRSNTATIRRKIKSQNLSIDNLTYGKQTQTPLGIVYMKNIVNDDLLQKVRDRLALIDTDSVITTSIIEDALSDDMNTTFPQVLATERPDKLSAALLEGRVGIIIDGIPFALIVPGTFIQFMQVAEDYSHKFIVASVVRSIRFLALIISIAFPALYIAITTFQPEMIPTDLALFIARSRAGITFPVAMETIMMLIAFEILFEAGLRVPKNIGQAVSIVGTLVVGQAAVEAKLVSPAIIVIIAMTAIASFTVPNQDLSNSFRLLRFVITVVSSFLGLLGFVLCIIVLTFRVCKLESFGVPYMSPFVSQDGKNNIDDTLFRIPLKFNKIRPISLKPKNVKRQGD